MRRCLSAICLLCIAALAVAAIPRLIIKGDDGPVFRVDSDGKTWSTAEPVSNNLISSRLYIGNDVADLVYREMIRVIDATDIVEPACLPDELAEVVEVRRAGPGLERTVDRRWYMFRGQENSYD